MTGTIGEIRLFASNFAPRNWALCHGQLLAINSFTALFSIFGTTYGGDGRTTFGLPDTRGRAVMGAGNGPGLTPRYEGQMGGAEYTFLSSANMPAHNHEITFTAQPVTGTAEMYVNNGASDQNSPLNNFLGLDQSAPVYASSSTGDTMATDAITLTINDPGLSGTTSVTGSNSSHYNMQPFTVMNYIVCMEGIYPSRN